MSLFSILLSRPLWRSMSIGMRGLTLPQILFMATIIMVTTTINTMIMIIIIIITRPSLGLQLARPSGRLALRLWRSTREGKVIIFRDTQTDTSS